MEIRKILSKTSHCFSVRQYSVIIYLQYWNYCCLCSLVSKRVIYRISSFHFVNSVWNVGRIFWQRGVNNNHLGFCFYESQSKFCFICWIVDPGKSNFWHMWYVILGDLKIFCLEWTSLHILNMSLSPIVLTFQGRTSDQIRKTWQSFTVLLTLT